jgi:hypothetical protein
MKANHRRLHCDLEGSLVAAMAAVGICGVVGIYVSLLHTWLAPVISQLNY